MSKKKRVNNTGNIIDLKLLQTLVEHSPYAVAYCNEKVIYINDTLSELCGLSKKKIIGQPITTLFHTNEKRKIKDILASLKAGEWITQEQRVLLKNGKYKWFEVAHTSISKTKPLHVISIFRELHYTNPTQRKTNELYQIIGTIAENIQDGIVIGVLGKKFIYANDSYLKMTKYKSMGELRKVHPGYIFVDRNEEKKVFRQLKERGIVKNKELQFYKKNKTKFWGRITVSRLNIEGYPDQFIGTIQDITREKEFNVQYKEAETKFDNLQANLTTVIENTSDRVFAVDKKFKYITYNKAHAAQAFIISGKKIKQGDNILKIFIQSNYQGIESDIKRALTGESFISEMSSLDNEIVEASYSPIRNKNQKVIGAAVFVRDITQRKLHEQKINALNEELIHQNWQLEVQEEELKTTLEELSNRNFELDQIMYKTSHDLRAPLSSMLGLINLAKADPDRISDYLPKIEERVHKFDEFTRSMLNYAKVSRADSVTTEINIEDLLKKCIEELDYIENHKQVNVQITCSSVKKMYTDVATLRLIFSNIISNAYKYHNPDADSYLNIQVEITNKEATIIFSDNGIGIKKEYLSKVFDMFFRGTEKSEGSGLGMYIVKQGINKLKGTIDIQSEYRMGTTIKIIIPSIE